MSKLQFMSFKKALFTELGRSEDKKCVILRVRIKYIRTVAHKPFANINELMNFILISL